MVTAVRVSDVKVGVDDDVPSIIVPADDTMRLPFVNADEELVPPLAMGNTPVTSAVKLIAL